jgi:hypothetical protein
VTATSLSTARLVRRYEARGPTGIPTRGFAVQDDGNIVIYSTSGAALWASRTVASYPYLYQAPALCNHVFRIDSATMRWDPVMQVAVSSSATFGYWNGHCVYKQRDTVGTDINTRELIVLTPYHQIGWHWDVLAAAGASAKACNPPGLSWVGILPVARAALTSWCAAAGAAGYVYSG